MSSVLQLVSEQLIYLKLHCRAVAADVTVIASSNVYTISKSALPSCAYVPASQSTDNTFAAPRVADNPRVATNTSVVHLRYRFR